MASGFNTKMSLFAHSLNSVNETFSRFFHSTLKDIGYTEDQLSDSSKTECTDQTTERRRIYEMEPNQLQCSVLVKKCKPNTHQIEEPFQCERSFPLSFVSNDHASPEVHHWARGRRTRSTRPPSPQEQYVLGQSKRFLRGCENFLPALA